MLEGPPVFQGFVNGIPKVEVPRKYVCPHCKKPYESTCYRAQDAVNLNNWIFIQQFLNSSPYLQLRIHSFRVEGLERQYSVNITNEKNIVMVSGGASTLYDAMSEMATAIMEKLQHEAKKQKKGG